ncbi:MAG: alpha/beta fold hydrolase [Bacteroidota bacterium]|nr:alpha/beta fold hydrolase [Bacteroidota bacterium]
MHLFRIQFVVLLTIVSFHSSVYSQTNTSHNEDATPTPSNSFFAKSAGSPSFVEVTDVRGYKALVLVPTNTAEAVNGKFPAILFLHGIGESGNDLNLLKQNGFPRVLEGDQQFPFIFIMPQCPSSTEWYYTNADNITAMRNFLDDIHLRFPIDSTRLYITGLSMGGIGSWYFAIKIPERFAALVPVSFRGDGWSPEPAKEIPVWAFHGAKDGVIPPSKAQELVDQFNAVGGSIRFEMYPDGGHDASTWGVTYNNPDVYDWMLRKKKVILSAPEDDSREYLSQKFSLDQNFPNPFNPTTTIKFGLQERSEVSLKVYDMLGREIASLIDNSFAAGYYNYSWNASGLPSGMYIYRIIATSSNGNSQQNFTQAKKMMFQK